MGRNDAAMERVVRISMSIGVEMLSGSRVEIKYEQAAMAIVIKTGSPYRTIGAVRLAFSCPEAALSWAAAPSFPKSLRNTGFPRNITNIRYSPVIIKSYEVTYR